ncbi:hypothetical protein F441_15125 [Phytophthora nicotianae CJ01A1]|uniref:Uncharacterized protein n=2 Tax=Phytophthora nicotianae TaxID=4792 RepID=W2WED5_PHYNI|nr:hypothetical protein F441_15125 [Phytophthora nicotianae CJ01A1]
MDEVNDSTSLNSSSLTSTSPRTSSWKRIEKKWNQVQVGLQGSYSVERLELLDHYCNNTSLVRVVLVCLFTPLPSLFVAVALECLPLQSPSAGWASNWMFWLRVSLMLLIINLAGASQGNLFVPGYNQTVRQVIYASIAVTLLQSGSFLLEAMIIGFPVPFMWQLGSMTMGIFVPIVTRFVNGPGVFVNGSALAQHHKRLLNSFFVHLALIGVYPLCRVLYDLIPHLYRGVVIFIIPLWKFAAKRFAVRMVHELEDFVPELVAFSVDFFSALFVSVCMSTSGSFHLTGLFITVDILFALVKFRTLHKDEKVIRQLLQDRRHMISSQLTKSESFGLLPMILEISVIPAPLTIVPRTAQLPPNLRKESSVRPTDPSKYLVLHGLQLLFNCEYLVLVEYIECVVPFVFVVYKSVLERLPNAVYFPGGSGNWGIPAVTNLLVFGVLEVGSLVLLHVFLQRKFGFSSLYQLAFVLETQASAIQAHLFPVTIFLLQYQLAHLGT